MNIPSLCKRRGHVLIKLQNFLHGGIEKNTEEYKPFFEMYFSAVYSVRNKSFDTGN